MKKILLLSMLNFGSCFSQSIWTAGPMLHFNFGGPKMKVSFGLEVAYWNFAHFPYSIDFCTEFEKQRIRLYSELQTGVGIAGVSAGPVMEIQTDKPAVKLGFQSSIWGNYFFGIDLRYRYIDKTSFFSPGTYLKIPFNGRDKNGKSNSSSSSNYSGGHH